MIKAGTILKNRDRPSSMNAITVRPYPNPLPEVLRSGSHAFYFCDPDGNRIEFYCWMINVSKASVAAPQPDL
jgi:catechol 2,3-dioxygenase-like lactoylglutathione lyase family enzyme